MDNHTSTLTTTELSRFCKLYHGEQNNPYNPNYSLMEIWAMEYLKFHIWEAENTFVTNYEYWREMWSEQNKGGNINAIREPLLVYGFVIGCKLRKMHRDDIDFERMYHNL